jgi:uncharacterized protein (DUF58 family)
MQGTLIPSTVGARAQPHGRLPFGFPSRFYVVLLLGLVWLIPAWWAPRLISGFFLWDGLVLLAWLVDLLRLPPPSAFEIRRTWHKALLLARADSVSIELHNSSSILIHAALIDETPLTLRDEPPSLSISVAPRSSASESYLVLPRERGDLSLGRVFLRYQSPLRLAERWAVADLPQKVRVHPDLERAGQHALYLIRSRQVEMGLRTRRQRGMGREFESLRDYREGDDPRDISWTATARRHQLITRVFQVERSQSVWLVVDAGRLLRAQVYDAASPVAATKLDYAVEAALSLAQVASQFGDKVGLVAYGRTIQQSVGLGNGALHIRELLDSLALVRGEASEANHARAAHALLRVQSRRSLIVWLTDFAETATTPEVIEYAMQMTRRHLVVFAAMSQPDLAVVAKTIPQTEEEMFQHAAALEVVERRELLIRRLRERGVLAVDLPPGALAGSLINQYLEVKDRALL